MLVDDWRTAAPAFTFVLLLINLMCLPW